ncbi:MAG: FAD-binding protein [Lentisphaerae bacterium]|nr:FAD-binding protein [Lentisphaerota bacterium]
MGEPYAEVDEGVLDRLRGIVGVDGVSVSEEDRNTYSHDEVAEIHHEPEAVVWAKSADEVSAILKLANEVNVPVTPRGAGQGLSGGAVPVFGGIVMSVEKMDRILEIDEENLMATVEPGVITGVLHREVEAKGLFYPPDPASLDSCSIGGNIAENAGGPRAVKYGITRHYVCGLEVVLPSGDIISLGGKIVKDVTGYDLKHLIIGSEGTLGVVTKIILRLIPLPEHRVDMLVPFNDFESASKSVSEIIKSRIVPTAMEFMGKDSVLAVEALTEKEIPFHEAAAHLLITMDGSSKEVIEADYERAGEICLENGAVDVLIADNPALRDKLWEARRLIIEALQHLSPERIMETEDLAVPRADIPRLLKAIAEIAEQEKTNIICFGHAGDGNVHVNVIKDMPEDVWQEKKHTVSEKMYKAALALGGAITGEHGIGLTRKEFLGLAVDAPAVELMRQIKSAFDPNGILNPGKILP